MTSPDVTPSRIDCVQLEANVDDLDPRIWPRVIEQLLAVGADDAWITPIVMKKGRPAFTLGVLSGPDALDDVRSVVFAETTTIGLREWTVTKHVLPRRIEPVTVDGQRIDTKVAWSDGEAVNRSIEWDDVVQVSAALGMAPKEVLAAAVAAAGQEDAS